MMRAPDGAGLEMALRAAGLPGRVEAQGAMAIIGADPATVAAFGAHRAQVLAMARAHGFSHACLEIPVGGQG